MVSLSDCDVGKVLKKQVKWFYESILIIPELQILSIGQHLRAIAHKLSLFSKKATLTNHFFL